jgi:hypothetical protein
MRIQNNHFQYGRVNAMQIVQSNFEQIVSGIEDVELPEILWNLVIPGECVDTSINPGARAASYLVRDRSGRGQFRARLANDVPTVGVALDKVTIPLEASGVGADFDIQDARAIEFGVEGPGLFNELGESMREASERHIEGVTWYGEDDVDYNGLIELPGVPVAPAAPNAGGTSSEWPNKDPDEILADVNDALTGVWLQSNTVHLAGTLLVPAKRYGQIATQRVSQNSDVSVLKIVPVRYLDNAGAGGTARMAATTFSKKTIWMPMPLPFQLLEPQPQGYGVKLYAEYIFGPTHIKHPLSWRYVDGI